MHSKNVLFQGSPVIKVIDKLTAAQCWLHSWNCVFLSSGEWVALSKPLQTLLPSPCGIQMPTTPGDDSEEDLPLLGRCLPLLQNRTRN